MCARYFIDDGLDEEVEHFLRGYLTATAKRKAGGNGMAARSGADSSVLRCHAAGDVYPSEKAVILRSDGAAGILWGFPSSYGKQLVINARAESAQERPMFRDCVKKRRCLIPARSFYEWDSSKNRTEFRRPDGKVLFMAGLYDCFPAAAGLSGTAGVSGNDSTAGTGVADRFVILTTAANESVCPVHSRMPLLLTPEKAADWLLDPASVREILAGKPDQLESRSEYSQLSLF